LPPPSSHTTVRRVPYTAVPGGLCFAVLNACHPISARRYLAASVRYLRPGPACAESAQGDQKIGPASPTGSALRRSVHPAPTASADFCRPIPTPRGAGSTRQGDRPPRVRRATFVPYTCRIYGRNLRVISGFGSFGPLARMRTPHMRFLFVRPALCLQLPSDPKSPRAPLLFG
jgi:hypothetical protein